MKVLKNFICFIGIIFFTSHSIAAQSLSADDRYNFVYATTASEISDEVQSLLSEFNGIVVYSFNELSVYRQLFTIDAFWFDASALDYLEVGFMRELHMNGVSITAFNVDPVDFAELLDAPFLGERYTLDEDEIVYITIEQIRLQRTTTPIVPYQQQTFSITRGMQAFSGHSVGSLSRADERQALLTSIPRSIAQIRELKHDIFKSFQNSLPSD